MEHYSVLLNESINALNIQKNGIYVDCTLGRGGHTKEILNQLGPDGRLYVFDQDIDAINKVKKTLNDTRVFYIHDNFRNLRTNLVLNGVEKVDGIIYDLGVSSPQFDEQSRGFSYRFDAELDMRMDQNSNKLTAKTIVNTYSKSELADIFFKYGDEKFSNYIANKIIEIRENHEISTTFDLVQIIKDTLPQKVLKQKKHPAKKVFQALRIYVNDELNAVEESLQQAIKILNNKGVISVITFHSLEEKVVKNIFKNVTKPNVDPVENKLPIMIDVKCDYQLLTKKPIVPNEKELEQNRRSHSAKLWALKKVGN